LIVTDIWTLAFSFRGRISRAMYWLGALLFLVDWLLLWIAFFTIPAGFFGASVGFIGVIVGFWLVFAVVIKRLHDRDKSGWYVLLYWVGPGLFQGIAEKAGRTQPLAIVVYVAGAALAIWAVVELGFLRGTAGPNRYGPDPLDRAAATAETP
jgi:uncharacterized membrane protein YhaH (DUF805 family)